jgi:hypothetical protein
MCKLDFNLSLTPSANINSISTLDQSIKPKKGPIFRKKQRRKSKKEKRSGRLDFVKMKTFALRNIAKRMSRQITDWVKIFKIKYLTKNSYANYIKISPDRTARKESAQIKK